MSPKATPKFYIPEGHRPEEFLRDAQLAEYHQWLLDEADPDDPNLEQLKVNAVRARVAAALTDQALTEATAPVEK